MFHLINSYSLRTPSPIHMSYPTMTNTKLKTALTNVLCNVYCYWADINNSIFKMFNSVYSLIYQISVFITSQIWEFLTLNKTNIQILSSQYNYRNWLMDNNTYLLWFIHSALENGLNWARKWFTGLKVFLVVNWNITSHVSIHTLSDLHWNMQQK